MSEGDEERLQLLNHKWDTSEFVTITDGIIRITKAGFEECMQAAESRGIAKGMLRAASICDANDCATGLEIAMDIRDEAGKAGS